jgi:hypothetical protein
MLHAYVPRVSYVQKILQVFHTDVAKVDLDVAYVHRACCKCVI